MCSHRYENLSGHLCWLRCRGCCCMKLVGRSTTLCTWNGVHRTHDRVLFRYYTDRQTDADLFYLFIRVYVCATRRGTMLLDYAKTLSPDEKDVTRPYIRNYGHDTYRRQSTYDECIKAIASERRWQMASRPFIFLWKCLSSSFFRCFGSNDIVLECLYSYEDFNVLFIEIGWTTMIFDEFVLIYQLLVNGFAIPIEICNVYDG